MLSVEEYEKRLESSEQYAPVTSNVGSLLSVYDTMDFQQKQTASDKALNLGKSVYNGFMSVPRGVLRGVQWLRDVNEAQLNEAHPERMQMDEGARQLLDDAADAEFLQPYEVRADSSAERFAYDLAQGAGQLGGQLAVGLATGGYGTLPAMALQIGGEEYKELREQGIDVETAGKAAAFNAAVQTPLEFIGFSKLTKAFPANSMLKQRLRHVAEDALTEGITEYLQEYPEQLSKIWAENADKSPEEIANIIWNQLGDIHSSATYSGLIGATLGTGAGGMHLALDHKLDRSIERAMQREVYTEMTEHVESTINRIKETGINPKYAGAVINDNLQNQTVYVDGEALAGYAQEKGAEKVAESLGVSVEDIEKAAASGDTVDVKLGNFEATCAAFDGFFQEVKDGTAFEDGGYTPKKEQAEQERIKQAQERYAELRDQFKAEENRIISEFAEAGVGKQLAMGQVELLKRFAENLNPDYALAIMQSYKVRRGENGEVQAGYGQFAGENAKTADKIKLTEAQTMESEGKSADEIYKATGWFKGLDNKWRFEIKDNFEGIDFTPLLGDDDHQVTLKEIYKNPKLYKAYPFLRNIKIYPNDFGGDNGKRGRAGTLQDDSPFIELNENLMRNEPERIKETLTHEIQHIIQAVERFAAGGARTTARKLIAEEIQRIAQSEDAGAAAALSSELDSSSSDYDLYRRLGGEQEARETARRAKIQNEIATVEKHIKEARRKGDKAALKRAQFAKALLERQNDGTPSPHQSDAIIVFDGKEIPYSQKQDEIFADAEEQNTKQAKSRSKEGGFFDAMKSLMQTNGEIKGKYNPYDNVVTMFKGADASTVIHETWHFFVEQMWNMVQSGNASEQTVKDFETLLSYAGMTREEWANADLDGRRKAHEKLAEAGETYIMEGKSPSYELRRVFRNFAKWLKAIYATIQRSENYAELTDDVREVFDRMLAAEDDIAHMERVNGYFAKLPDAITENMSDETRAKVEDYIEKAREKAVDILTRRSLVNYTKERRKEIKKFKDEIRPMVEDEVSKRPVYACGYNKKDAARFRELRNQQESVGIWTDENFIDRAFPADTNPVENEVAHLAAAVNPKNWTKGLGEVKKDYQRQADEVLQPAINTLESGIGQGVDIVQNQDGTTGRVSNNAQWYRDFYAANKRKPTKTELWEMARQLVSGDVNAPQVEGWMPTTAEEAEAMQAEGERLADIERHIAACDEIKEKLADVKKNYAETSAAGSEEFLFRAELTAEQYGYSSADEMMQDIEKSPTKAEAVKQRINERVQELTMQDERNNYEAMIRESLYNEDEALLIGIEQQLIEEYAAKAKERQEANERKAEERAEQRNVNAEVAAARKQQAKNAARADLTKMNVKEATRTNKFITAERNAAMKSAKLLAQKKFDEALTQKNLQAYWHAMAAESMKIARRQKQYEKFLKKQVSLKRESWLNDTHFGAISLLFDRMGIANAKHKEAAAASEFKTLQEYAAAMEGQFDCVDIAPWILEGSTPISDTNALTLEQYEDVVNAVKNIKAIVKAQKGADMFASKEAWKETKAGIIERLSKLKTLWKPDPNKVSKPSKIEEWLAGLETMDTFCEMLDGGRYGWFSQHWNNLMKRCQDREYDMREAYDKAETDALKKWLPDKAAENAANEKIYYEELGESVTKHTLVRMLINLGNKENSQRICETVPVGFENSTLWVMPDESLAVNQKELKAMREEAREQTRQNLMNFLGKLLTKEDVEYAQRKINAAGMNWAERVELDRRTKGFAPKKVEATPVVLNIGGEQVVLQGGYFPLMRYGETGSHPASAEVQPDEELQGRRIRTYHTNTSASKARTNARYAVDLRLGTERSSIYESIHDLCWREAMSDFRRVLNDQDVYAMLKSKVGISRMNLFKELLEVSADGQNSKALSAFEQSMVNATGWLTSKTANSLIMCSLKVTTQNGADAFLYGNAVDGYTMADNISALGRYMMKWFNPSKQKEMQDFVFSKSAYMKERSLIPDVTIRDIISENKERKWEKVVRETTTKMFAYTDNATAIPNWIQAYNKKLNEGATEQEAIDFADTVVRRVKGSSRNTEVSSMQRSKAYKPITMFQSFFNARLNEFLRMERYAANQWTDGQKAEAFSTVASYVMGKFIMQAMLSLAFALENPFGVDDEDGWPNLIKELKSQTFSMFGPFGQAASGIVGAAAGMHEFDYRMSAIESTVNKGISAVRAVKSDKKSTAEKVEVVTNFASLTSGAPMQITKVFWNLFDIAFNGMTPELGDLFRRRPKKERK